MITVIARDFPGIAGINNTDGIKYGENKDERYIKY
jgi:hypothetical protein